MLCLDEELNEDKDKPIGKCPNASNPYHKCGEYCYTRWGSTAENEVCLPWMPNSWNSHTLNSKNIHVNIWLFKVDYSQVPVPPGWFLVPHPSRYQHSTHDYSTFYTKKRSIYIYIYIDFER